MELVFDVGATHMRLALSKDGKGLGEVVRRDSENSPAGFQALLEEIRRLRGDLNLDGVAGGIAAQIDDAGVLNRAGNLTAWNGLQIVRELEAAAGCKVLVANDVEMAGFGEAHAGAGSDSGVMVYFTISTGVNAVRLVDGRIDKSIRSFNIGRQLLSDAEGRVVSLEELTGGSAFERRRNESPREVRDGRTWRAEEHYLARALFNTAIHWTPDMVVFGGSMMRDIDVEALEAELDELPQVLDPRPKLRRAKLADEAGLRGALAMLRHRRD